MPAFFPEVKEKLSEEVTPELKYDLDIHPRGATKDNGQQRSLQRTKPKAVTWPTSEFTPQLACRSLKIVIQQDGTQCLWSMSILSSS